MYMHIVAAMEPSPSAPGPILAPVPVPPTRPADPPADPPAGRTARQPWNPRLLAILFVLCGALFLDALDVSMIGVALPVIRTDLHLNTSSLQWIVSAYVLGYGGPLLLGGPAHDPPGRRRVFLVALGLFAAASLLGGLVSGAALLIAARFVNCMAAARDNH